MGLSVPFIFVQGSAYPMTVDITFILIDLENGTPIPNQHGTFSTSLGTLELTSFETDENGYCTAILTSGSQAGMAIVVAMPDTGLWPGIIEVPILNTAEVPVNISNKQDFQLFIQGKQYLFNAGTYNKSYTMTPQDCSLTLAQVDPAITGPFLIHIYRRGVLDFSGRISKIKNTIDNKQLISGLSNHTLLSRRLVTANYPGGVDIEGLIDLLLFNYPVGVTPGNIQDYGQELIVTFQYDTLVQALQNIVSQTGWGMRLNVDETLDFGDPGGSEFARQPPVTLVTGTDNTDVEDELDFTQLVTRSFMVGQPNTLIDSKFDAVAAAKYGLFEAIYSASNLKDATSLSLANQTTLNVYKAPVETLTVGAIDEKFAYQDFNPWDFITIVDPNTGISGLRRVTSISRDMMKKGLVTVGSTTIPVDPVTQFTQIISELGFKNLAGGGSGPGPVIPFTISSRPQWINLQVGSVTSAMIIDLTDNSFIHILFPNDYSFVIDNMSALLSGLGGGPPIYDYANADGSGTSNNNWTFPKNDNVVQWLNGVSVDVSVWGPTVLGQWADQAVPFLNSNGVNGTIQANV